MASTAVPKLESPSPILSLLPAVQNYAWGIAPAAADCIVARMHAYATAAEVDATRPYAELWIGTHPSGPALVRDTLEPLLDHLQKKYPDNPAAVPPFLLKILSVAKPLSIQAHPDKELAKVLHQQKPDKYKDDNHKPEMCVALTDFEGMCNFRPSSEILANLESVPPFAELCGGETAVAQLRNASSSEEKRAALRNLFSSLMSASEDSVAAALKESIKAAKAVTEEQNSNDLFLRLVGYYPGDVGCFAAYLLNHVRISPGQAFFMAANEPHAYLKGQCVEIMALSDNVVRAGLTPKFKDVNILVDMLTYKDDMPTIMNGETVDKYSTIYKPPVTEFELMKTIVPAGETYEVPVAKGPAVVMVVGGNGWIGSSDIAESMLDCRMPLNIGSVYYAADSKPLVVQADSAVVAGATSPDLFFFRASVRQD